MRDNSKSLFIINQSYSQKAVNLIKYSQTFVEKQTLFK